LPDPRKFGLVIDNGCNIETDGVGVDPAASVAHPLFLAGLSEAQGLLLAIGSCRQSDEESWHRTLNGKGYSPWISPAFIDAGPLAASFKDFMIEFSENIVKAGYQTPRIPGTAASHRPSEFEAIFDDEWGDPRVCCMAASSTLKVLYIPDIMPVDEKVSACTYLIDHVFPQLAPDAYGDVLVPVTVRELVERKRGAIARFREEMSQLAADEVREQAYFSTWKPLVRVLGEPLKQLVMAALRDLWAFDVVDLDEGAEREKRCDVLATFGPWRTLIETTGSGSRAARARADLEPFQRNIEKNEAALGRVDARILIFNPHTTRPLSERQRLRPFADDFVEEALSDGIALLTTFELFHAIELQRMGRMNTDRFRDLIGKPGLVRFSSD
jgi:hypothetical protein